MRVNLEFPQERFAGRARRKPAAQTNAPRSAGSLRAHARLAGVTVMHPVKAQICALLGSLRLTVEELVNPVRTVGAGVGSGIPDNHRLNPSSRRVGRPPDRGSKQGL